MGKSGSYVMTDYNNTNNQTAGFGVLINQIKEVLDLLRLKYNVTDGNIIIARNAEDVVEFSKAIIVLIEAYK